MIDSMGDREFHCANYVSKEQPHIEGLLHTLADSVKSLEYSLAKTEDSGDEPLEALERARRLLHRLLSATNRRMHKGFPETLSYLWGSHRSTCRTSLSHCHLNLVFDKEFVTSRATQV